MVQMLLVSSEPLLSLFCYKQVEECKGERSAESGKNCTKEGLLGTNAKLRMRFLKKAFVNLKPLSLYLFEENVLLFSTVTSGDGLPIKIPKSF